MNAAFLLAMLVVFWFGSSNDFGVKDQGSAFWPVIGLYFGAALRAPRRMLPWLAVTAAVGWQMFSLVHPSAHVGFVAHLLAWFGNTVAVFAGAYVYRCHGKKLLLPAMVGVPAISAALMTGMGKALGIHPFASGHWVTYFEADGLGVLVVTPFVLALLEAGDWRRFVARRQDFAWPATILVTVFGASVLLFTTGPLPAAVARPFLIIPFLVLAAFQGRRLLSATATFIVALVVVWATSHGTGPFHGSGQQLGVVVGEMQLFIATTTLMSILLTDAVVARQDMASALQAMMRSKEQLLMDVSHELKSPLARMKMAVAFLKDGRMQAHLSRDVGEMERMVAELLETARLQSPHGDLHREPTDLAGVVRSALEPLAAQRPGVVVEAPDELRANVDGHRLAIVARNLVDNALKYSEPDGPAVQVRLGSDGQAITLSVRDFGLGIPKEDVPHLFEPFYRVDKSRSKESGGHGLGLSLCHRIVTAHGGSIDVTPEATGTRVVVALPV